MKEEEFVRFKYNCLFPYIKNNVKSLDKSGFRCASFAKGICIHFEA